MKVANNPSQSQRFSDSGFVWEEKLAIIGTIEVPAYSTIRVRATGATTVTIAGVLAATMTANEIMIFNVGVGDKTDAKATVTVTTAVANAYVQVAKQ